MVFKYVLVGVILHSCSGKLIVSWLFVLFYYKQRINCVHKEKTWTIPKSKAKQMQHCQQKHRRKSTAVHLSHLQVSLHLGYITSGPATMCHLWICILNIYNLCTMAKFVCFTQNQECLWTTNDQSIKSKEYSLIYWLI